MSEDSTMLLRTPRRYRIEMDGHGPTLNARLHWAARHRQNARIRDAVAGQARMLHRGAPLARARVTVTLYRRGGRAKDRDNAYAAAKAAIDGLSGVLIVDDDEAHIDLVVRQQIGVKRCMMLEVEEVL